MSDIKEKLESYTDAADRAKEVAKDGITGEEVKGLIEYVKGQKGPLAMAIAVAAIVLTLAMSYFGNDKPEATEEAPVVATEQAPTTEAVATEQPAAVEAPAPKVEPAQKAEEVFQ